MLTRKGKCVCPSLAPKTGNQPPKLIKVSWVGVYQNYIPSKRISKLCMYGTVDHSQCCQPSGFQQRIQKDFILWIFPFICVLPQLKVMQKNNCTLAVIILVNDFNMRHPCSVFHSLYSRSDTFVVLLKPPCAMAVCYAEVILTEVYCGQMPFHNYRYQL